MTFQEKIVEKYMAKAVEEFDTNPLAMGFLRRLANESPAIFFPAAMDLLRSNAVSNAHRFLTVLALRQEEVTAYLASPSTATRETALRLFRRFLAVDPSFDVKLARRLPDRGFTNHAAAFDAARCTRALDILDHASRGRRLLPILGHLPNSPDHRVAAKATLFVGRRVQNPSWTSKLLSRPDQRVRANAVEALWGLDTQPAVQLLEKCIDDKNNRVLGNALVGLHVAGKRGIDTELNWLSRTGTAEKQATAAWVMGQVAQERWVEQLTAMVKSEHPQVRSMALRSLMEIRRHENNATGNVVTKNLSATDNRKSELLGQAEKNIDTYGYDAFPNVRYAR